MLIDTHCHLDFPEFDPDRTEVIQRAIKEGIGYIINIGSSLRGSRAGIELSRRYDCIYTTVGIHPHEADRVSQDTIIAIKELIENDKVVAIGETGLDYYKVASSKENQKQLFISLLELARINSLPVVIHCRQSQEDVYSILREKNITRAVLHCFSGDENFLRRCLEAGFFISYTCNVTYKKAEALSDLVGITPLDRLFLETDAPFLPPEGFRGKRNEPFYIKHLAQAIARVKNISVEEVCRITSENAKGFFNLR